MANTGRPTKSFSGKYTHSISGVDKSNHQASGHFSLTDGSNKARNSLKQVYCKYKATPYVANQRESVMKIAAATEMFMVKSEPEKRLSEFALNMMDLSLDQCETLEGLQGVTRGFGILEEYALKLAWYPWKKQIHKIKVHAAYVKMYVEPYIKGFKDVFRKLGYKRGAGDELIIERLPERDVIMAVAFDCYVAHKELGIYVAVFSKVQTDGYTVRDVHQCRLKVMGTDVDCVNWIVKNCTPKPKPTFTLKADNADFLNLKDLDESLRTGVVNKKENVNVLNTEQALRMKEYEEEARKTTHDVTRSANMPRSSDYLQNIGANLKGGEYGSGGSVPRQGGRVPPDVPPRGSSVSRPIAPKTFEINPPTLPIDRNQKPSEFKAGTLDEHVSESLRLLDADTRAATTTTSNEVTTAPNRHGGPVSAGMAEWSAVYKTMEGLGDKYNDPGGRGDILKGDRMVPREDDDDEDFPPPPKPEELYRPSTTQSRDYGSGHIETYNASKYALDALQPQSHTSGYGSKPTEVMSSLQSTRHDGTSMTMRSAHVPSRQDGQSHPRVNLTHSSDIYSADIPPNPFTGVNASNKGLGANVSDYNTGVGDQPQSLKIRHDPFTSPASIQSAISNVPDSGLSSQHFSTFGISNISSASRPPTVNPRGTEDPDYVHLKEVTSPEKPSFEKNFQDTTQRLYQAQSNTSLARQGGVIPKTTAAQSRDPPPTKPREGMTTRSQARDFAANQSRSLQVDRSRDAPDGQSAADSRGGKGSKENKKWQCTSCTFMNLGSAVKCEICGKSRVKGAEEKPLSIGGPQCKTCTFINKQGAKTCETCDHELKDSPTFV